MESNSQWFIGTDEILQYENINDKQRLILMKLTALSNSKGFAFCSNEYLSELFGITKNNISRYVNDLQEKGYINCYYNENNYRKIAITKYVYPIAKNSNTYCQKQQYPIAKNSNYKDKVLNIKNKDKDMNTFDTEKAFEIFWKEYPKKNSKHESKKKFITNCKNEEVFNKIMNSLAKFKQGEDWTKDNGKFIPYASTWLHQRRYEDEIEDGKVKGTDYEYL